MSEAVTPGGNHNAPGPVTTTTIELDQASAPSIIGVAEKNLKAIAALIDCDVFARGQALAITGPAHEVQRARQVVTELGHRARRGEAIDPEMVRHVVGLVTADAPPSARQLAESGILAHRGKVIRPQTPGQSDYVDAIDAHTIVFGIGPAGTGKTYLAMAKAVQALKDGEVTRIILTRPAVEAGEKLGFLPGTLDQKIDPYLRPLYDALRDMVEPDKVNKLMEAGVIEVAPLAYMRGRTLNDAFVILDEAQNTTAEQMKMFLTRLGFGSKMVVTGDITQVDLPGGRSSGLSQARRVLRGVQDIYFAELTARDVVRHALVSRIVEAYDRFCAGGKRKDNNRDRARRAH
ncbi:phosphate starvation protein PhoH [Corynebacterium atypicum]|uniref:PhoH-like protein n=1 Tax=Corynebacterium atypicum TaxID=191610 RepID=A0ABM5QNW7_9CORY|nr:PhoH family protein [Corynebacterium atypicum]AIG64512.1 phosphate starvation protein PhoH [Corynebacterium atypicum]